MDKETSNTPRIREGRARHLPAPRAGAAIAHPLATRRWPGVEPVRACRPGGHRAGVSDPPGGAASGRQDRAPHRGQLVIRGQNPLGTRGRSAARLLRASWPAGRGRCPVIRSGPHGRGAARCAAGGVAAGPGTVADGTGCPAPPAARHQRRPVPEERRTRPRGHPIPGLPDWPAGPVRPRGPQTGFRGARKAFRTGWELGQPTGDLHEVTAHGETGALVGRGISPVSRARRGPFPGAPPGTPGACLPDKGVPVYVGNAVRSERRM
jgi:hypothetical protein